MRSARGQANAWTNRQSNRSGRLQKRLGWYPNKLDRKPSEKSAHVYQGHSRDRNQSQMSKAPVPGLTARGYQSWIANEVVPRLPDPERWIASSFGVAERRREWFARGIVFSGSSGPWFMAHAVVDPLFVPATLVNLSHGKILPGPGGQRGFDGAEGPTDGRLAEQVAESFAVEGLPLIEARGNLKGFLQHLLRQQQDSLASGGDVPYAEEAGYCRLLLGDRDGAMEQLRYAARPVSADAPPWDVAARDRAREILAIADDADAVERRLRHWAAEKAAAIGLPSADDQL